MSASLPRIHLVIRSKVSLSAKVRLLVLIPLCLQLVFLIVLAYLLNSANEQLHNAERARKISDGVDKISAGSFKIASFFMNKSGLGRFNIDELAAQQVVSESSANLSALNTLSGPDAEQKLRELEELTKDNPKLHAEIMDSVERGKAIHEMVLHLYRLKDTPGADARIMQFHIFQKLQHELPLSFSNLSRILQEQRSAAEIFSAKNLELTELSQRVAVSMGIFNLILSAVIAIFLTKNIAARLRVLNDNSYRLASNLALNKRVGGDDEIAAVDDSFHKMAKILRESARRERAIIDNAPDLICTIDGAGKFTAVNPACQQVLGRNQEDLFNSHLGDVLADGRERAQKFMSDLKQGENMPPCEMQLKRADGDTRYTLVSAHWSEEEGTAFCVFHDISDRRKAELLRKELVAMITHDLRSPLMTLGNIMEFLPSGKFGQLDEKGQGYCRMGVFNIERMSMLVNDLLDIEKIESGQMQLEREEVFIDDCFETCRASMSALADAQHVTLRFVSTELSISADLQKMERILINLVSNAIKFSPENSEVKVSAETDDAGVRVTVEDRGKGIPQDKLDDVFKRFQRVHKETKDEPVGSGLGLSICKSFVELHGGRIWVESEVGAGSKFIFMLPYKIC